MNIYLLFMSLYALSGFVRGAGKRNRTLKVRSVFDPTEIMRIFEMPKSCKNERREFCIDNDNYPIDIVKDLLENVTGLVVTTKEPSVEDNGSYEAREGPPFVYDCYTSSEIEPIYYIVDEAGKDRVVVQLEGKFQQEFSIKMCELCSQDRSEADSKSVFTLSDIGGSQMSFTFSGAILVIGANTTVLARYRITKKLKNKEGPISTRPHHFMNHVAKNNKIYCQNKYMHYEFMVLSTEPDEDGKWKMEKARTKTGIPVCCICRYHKEN